MLDTLNSETDELTEKVYSPYKQILSPQKKTACDKNAANYHFWIPN